MGDEVVATGRDELWLEAQNCLLGNMINSDLYHGNPLLHFPI